MNYGAKFIVKMTTEEISLQWRVGFGLEIFRLIGHFFRMFLLLFLEKY